MAEVRLLDLGFVSALRSQTLYHAVAESVSKGSPDTINILSPAEPYVCIGMHQELENEVDLEYCRTHNLPVYRRQVGGGAVFLDKNQIFYQVMFHKDHAPANVNEIYEKFLKAPIETYRAFGINAVYRPINDIQVDNKKIGGTGAATIGNCTVVVGSIILDFDYKAMSKVLKVPDEKFRDKVYKTMETYLTTMKRELDEVPPRDEIKKMLIKKFEESLDIELVEGKLTDEEMKLVEEFDKKFQSYEWLHKVSREKHGFRDVKISEGVRVVETAHKVAGGLIRTVISLENNIIRDIMISGDFFMYPDAIAEIEDAVTGIEVRREDLLQNVWRIYDDRKIRSPGVLPENFVEAIMKAVA